MHRREMREHGRRAAAAILAGAIALALAACGPAPWTLDDPEDPAASTSPVVIPPPVPNDLSSGSTERELQAGPASAAITYWSTLSMDRWTPAAIKPVSLSLITQVTPDNGQKVYLQKAAMLAVPANDTTTFSPLEEQADAAAVNPGYLVLDPYSYSQTFNVGPTPAEATFVTLHFTYDFLVQTTPTSKEYAKQTATDTVTVALTPQPVSEE